MINKYSNNDYSNEKVLSIKSIQEIIVRHLKDLKITEEQVFLDNMQGIIRGKFYIHNRQFEFTIDIEEFPSWKE